MIIGKKIEEILDWKVINNLKYLRDHTSIAYPSAVHMPCLCHAVNSELRKLEIPNFLYVTKRFSF